ncbi:MAG: hypothetical protein ACHQ15_04985 [Candidatus Limnocylindrales bacterium]
MVELGPEGFWTGAPRRFFVDGAAYSLGRFLHIGPRHCAFRVGGLPATLTMRAIWPGAVERDRGARRAFTGWLRYELVVDGQAEGSWVLRQRGMRWRFFAPGTPIPEPSLMDRPQSSPPDEDVAP